MTDKDLEKPIAYGRTAEIYAWRDGTILKLFRKEWQAGSVEKEAELARLVHACGAPVPAIYENVKIDERLGLVYERVNGPSMLAVISKQPWKVIQMARLLAELHADLHNRVVPQLPSLHRRIEARLRSIPFPEPSILTALLRILSQLPDGNRLCHGDFHPGNVLITRAGPVIIDWMDAASGNPLADLCRTALLGRHAILPTASLSDRVIIAVRRWFFLAYWQRYDQLQPVDTQEFSQWEPVIAAARLAEGISEEMDSLISQVRRGLSRANIL